MYPNTQAGTMTGQKAPDFTLPAHDGSSVSLSDFRGRTVILYFYPKDDTPGCTREACDFRDSFPRFGKADAVVLGISPDKVEAHARFREKYQLPFTLLSDRDHKVTEQYGAWKQKKSFGTRYMGVVRTTFVIDPDGVIQERFEVKRVAGHVDAVLAALP